MNGSIAHPSSFLFLSLTSGNVLGRNVGVPSKGKNDRSSHHHGGAKANTACVTLAIVGLHKGPVIGGPAKAANPTTNVDWPTYAPI
jgi:hypothetical protein